MTTWHGTRQEQYEILRAVSHNCACHNSFGMVVNTCAAHVMLATDQRALDGLLWERRLTKRRLLEEFGSV